MIRTFPLLSVIFVTLFTSGLQGQNSATPLQWDLAAQKGDCETALPELRVAITLNPRNQAALTTLGVCETRLGHPDRATESFERVVSIAPSDWRAWSNLGANHLALNRVELAVAAFRKAIKFHSGSASLWVNLSQALERQAKDNEAFQALDRAQLLNALDPQIKTAWLEVAGKLAARAADQIENKKYQEARVLLLKVCRPLENSASWNNLMGYVEFKLGDREPALEHLQKALRIEPDNEDFLMDLGEYLLVYRAYQTAREIFQQGLNRHPNSSRIRFALATVYQVEKRHEEAISLLGNLIASDPRFEPAYNALGRSFEKTLQWEAMIDLGKRLLALNPSSSLAWYLIGAGLLGTAAREPAGLDEAMSALQRSLVLNRGSSRTHFLLAKAYKDKGDSKAAIDRLKESLRLDPQQEEAHYVLAQLYRKMGKQELAGEEFKAYETLRRQKSDEAIRLLVVNADRSK